MNKKKAHKKKMHKLFRYSLFRIGSGGYKLKSDVIINQVSKWKRSMHQLYRHRS